MPILSETYEPETDTGEDLLTNSGEEGGVIVEGELELTVADRQRKYSTNNLGPGAKKDVPTRGAPFLSTGQAESGFILSVLP